VRGAADLAALAARRPASIVRRWTEVGEDGKDGVELGAVDDIAFEMQLFGPIRIQPKHVTVLQNPQFLQMIAVQIIRFHNELTDAIYSLQIAMLNINSTMSPRP
jgi:hypothetical protein